MKEPMKEPLVSLTMSEYSKLLEAAGLSPGRHGISDLKKLLGLYGQIEEEVSSLIAADAKILKRYRFASLSKLIEDLRFKS